MPPRTKSDPRAELVRRLLEYEQMKLAAQKLDALPHRGRDFFTVQVWMERTLTAAPAAGAARRTSRTRGAAAVARARVRQHHRVTRDELSVREHMTEILRKLAGAGFVEFSSLFDPWRGVPVLVVNFLAVLELARESLIEVTQSEPYAPIYVKLAFEPEAGA